MKRNRIRFVRKKCPCGNSVIYPDEYCSYECSILYKTHSNDESNTKTRLLQVRDVGIGQIKHTRK
ncbi:unnamed protein product [marine sediment metagenome]|uniref:Uncharacterized protein n=1 Tax=marine sediment metagenome TaxID=412755 RepID=X1E9A1_9ZZZZ